MQRHRLPPTHACRRRNTPGKESHGGSPTAFLGAWMEVDDDGGWLGCDGAATTASGKPPAVVAGDAELDDTSDSRDPATNEEGGGDVRGVPACVQSLGEKRRRRERP